MAKDAAEGTAGPNRHSKDSDGSGTGLQGPENKLLRLVTNEAPCDAMQMGRAEEGGFGWAVLGGAKVGLKGSG